MKNKITSINNCLNCKNAGCNNHCFTETNIKEIINLLKDNKIDEAVKLQYQQNSIGFICGKLCDHIRGCLGGCNNKKYPVKTNEICFYLGVERLNLPLMKMNSRNKHVVIIGGGVAGLVCAEQLLEKGFSVSIYEKSNSLGGVLNKTMPHFRYEMNYFIKWIDRLINLGLKINLNTEVKSIEEVEKYDYLVIATGADIAKRLYDDTKTIDALKVLELAKLNKLNYKGLDVVVLGGGNTAYDVARVMKSLGNNVSIAYRRDIKNSPAAINEVELAISEGIKVLECLAPKDIIIKGDKKELVLNKTLLINDGGKRLNFVESTERISIQCDLIIEAIGANSNLKFIKENYPFLINEKDYVSDIENKNIYDIGDAYSGASTFANANNSARICSSKIIEKEKRTVLFCTYHEYWTKLKLGNYELKDIMEKHYI